MMGVRGVGDKEEFGRVLGTSEAFRSRSTSPGSTGGSTGNVHGLGLGESEYVSVYGLPEDQHLDGEH
jgi:hypothetical protein